MKDQFDNVVVWIGALVAHVGRDAVLGHVGKVAYRCPLALVVHFNIANLEEHSFGFFVHQLQTFTCGKAVGKDFHALLCDPRFH